MDRIDFLRQLNTWTDKVIDLLIIELYFGTVNIFPLSASRYKALREKHGVRNKADEEDFSRKMLSDFLLFLQLVYLFRLLFFGELQLIPQQQLFSS